MSMVVDLVLALLRVDPSCDQQYVWAPEAEELLARLLDVLFEHPEETRPGLEDLWRSVCALDLELRSPQTADRLRSILKADPRVRAVFDGARTEEVREAHTHWAGGEDSKQAPIYGGSAPAGTIRASALVDPISRRRLERPDRHLDRVAVAQSPAIARPRNRRP